MQSSWRSKCLFSRPAKFLDACKNGGWLYGKPTRPFLQGHSFTVMCEQYCATTHAWWERWCSQCLFESPSPTKPATQCCIVNANSTSPCANAHSFFVERDSLGMGSVLSLLYRSCPSAIDWFVVAVIVNSINRVLWAWLFAHINQKVRKRLQPALANCDASSSIAVIVRSARIAASSLHFFPSAVFRAVFSRESACCHSFIRKNRIARNHLKLLISYWVVRAESVNHDRLGSFHCAMLHKVVQ